MDRPKTSSFDTMTQLRVCVLTPHVGCGLGASCLHSALLPQKRSDVIERQARVVHPVVVPIAPMDRPPKAVKQPYLARPLAEMPLDPLIELAYALIVIRSHGLVAVAHRRRRTPIKVEAGPRLKGTSHLSGQRGCSLTLLKRIVDQYVWWRQPRRDLAATFSEQTLWYARSHQVCKAYAEHGIV